MVIVGESTNRTPSSSQFEAIPLNEAVAFLPIECARPHDRAISMAQVVVGQSRRLG
jgi:hypothetical protein